MTHKLVKCAACGVSSASINDMCGSCYRDIQSGGDKAEMVAEMFLHRILELSERISELEQSHQALAHDQLEIAKLLSDAGIEHSGFEAQAPRVQMLVERLRKSQENVIAFAKERNELRKRLNV